MTAVITDTERIAVSILDAGAVHPVVSRWITALITNPDETRQLTEFSAQLDSELQAGVRTMRFALPHEMIDGFATVFDDRHPYPRQRWQYNSDEFTRRHDNTLHHVAYHLVMYRRSGRADASELVAAITLAIRTIRTLYAQELEDYT